MGSRLAAMVLSEMMGRGPITSTVGYIKRNNKRKAETEKVLNDETIDNSEKESRLKKINKERSRDRKITVLTSVLAYGISHLAVYACDKASDEERAEIEESRRVNPDDEPTTRDQVDDDELPLD